MVMDVSEGKERDDYEGSDGSCTVNILRLGECSDSGSGVKDRGRGEKEGTPSYTDMLPLIESMNVYSGMQYCRHHY